MTKHGYCTPGVLPLDGLAVLRDASIVPQFLDMESVAWRFRVIIAFNERLPWRLFTRIDMSMKLPGECPN